MYNLRFSNSIIQTYLLDKQFDMNIYLNNIYKIFIHTNKFVKAKNSSPGLNKHEDTL